MRPPALGAVACAAALCGLLVVSPRATGMAAPPDDLAAADIVTVIGSGREMGERQKAEQAETESGGFYHDVHGIDEVDLDAPDSVVVNGDGTIYIADTGNDRIRAVAPGDDRVRTVAGTAEHLERGDELTGGSESADEAHLNAPRALTLGPDHTLYFVDYLGGDTTLRAVDARTGLISTVAGTGRASRKASSSDRYPGGRVAGDGGRADKAALDQPAGIYAASDGVLYVADTGNNRIRAIGDVDVDARGSTSPL